MEHDHASDGAVPTTFWRSRYAIGLIFFGAVAMYLLLTEHRAHFFVVLPFLLLLACPLMHVFMHHGHGSHAGVHAHGGADDRGPAASAAPRGATEGDQP